MRLTNAADGQRTGGLDHAERGRGLNRVDGLHRAEPLARLGTTVKVLPGSSVDLPLNRPAPLIIGTAGAGKTSVVDMVGDLLADAAVTRAVIDANALRRSWPPSPGDRFKLRDGPTGSAQRRWKYLVL